jgi:CRISPR/Cas system-associated protein Csm6
MILVKAAPAGAGVAYYVHRELRSHLFLPSACCLFWTVEPHFLVFLQTFSRIATAGLKCASRVSLRLIGVIGEYHSAVVHPASPPC